MSTHIRNEAEKALNKSRFANAEDIARANGCKILYMPLGDGALGFTTTNNRCHTIVLDNNLDEVMRDFVLLHEVGHKIMHPGISAPFFKRVGSNSFIPRIEREAHEFALNLIQECVPDTKYMSDHDLANYFGLPYEIALQRPANF